MYFLKHYGYLSHHGIKGQRWGKRNGPPYPLSDATHNKVVKKGTKFTRWSDKKETTIRRGTYVDSNKHDIKEYLNDMLEGKLGVKATNDIYRIKIEAIDYVTIKKSQYIIDDVLSKTKNVKMLEIHNKLKEIGYYDMDVNKRGKMFNSNEELKQLETNKLASYMHNKIYKDNNFKSELFDKYRKKGIDAIQDPEDVLWNYNDPTIIINPDKFKISSNSKASNTEKVNAKGKYISNLIAWKTEKDRKDPVGNQNCMLCLWSAERYFRGKKVLPRAVYSPRDPIFKLDPKGIVKDAKVHNNISISKVKDILKQAGNGSRFYAHVNWAGGKGGHEFLCINNGGKIYVLDGQDATYTTIDSPSGKSYFSEINPKNSYIFRLDDKELNKEYLKFNNNEYIVDWDEKKDLKLL